MFIEAFVKTILCEKLIFKKRVFQMIVNLTLYSVLERTNAGKSRFLINQWSMAFGDLGDIWTVKEYLRLFCEQFHLDEGSVLFAASFSPKTPSILPAAPISNVRPPGICSCRAERRAAGAAPRHEPPAAPAPLPSGENQGSLHLHAAWSAGFAPSGVLNASFPFM